MISTSVGGGGVNVHTCSALGLNFRFATDHVDTRGLTSLSFGFLVCKGRS